MGIADGDSTAKALAAAATTRDADNSGSSGKGSSWLMASTRAQDATAGDEWKTVWTAPTFTNMNTWKGLTGVSSDKMHAWWKLAAAYNSAVKDWHAFWTANSAAFALGSFV